MGRCVSRRGGGALVQHQKPVHRTPLERVRFECESCGLVCETEVAGLNPDRSCEGTGWGSIGESVVCVWWADEQNELCMVCDGV